MAMLSTARADSVNGVNFVVAHNELEAALSKIFGIEVGKNITASIFGSVADDGTIFNMRFTSGSRSSNPETQAGIIFEDGVTTKKLTYVDSKISVWTKNGNGWTNQEYDYEGDNEPALTDFADCQSIAPLDGTRSGKVVMTSSGTPPVFSLGSNEVFEGGAQSWMDLDEVKAVLPEWEGSNPLWSTPGQFGASAIGKLIGVSGANSLSPVAIPSGTMPTAAAFKTTVYMTSEGFVTPSKWVRMYDEYLSSGYPALAVSGGVNNAGFAMEAGAYAVKLYLNVHVADDMKGVFKWSVGGGSSLRKLNGFGSYITVPVPFYYSQSIATTIPVPTRISYPGASDPRFDCGTYVIVMKSPGTINTTIWQNTTGAMSVELTLTITRIS